MQTFITICWALGIFVLAIILKLRDAKKLDETERYFGPVYWVLLSISSVFFSALIFPNSVIGTLALSVVFLIVEHIIAALAEHIHALGYAAHAVRHCTVSRHDKKNGF